MLQYPEDQIMKRIMLLISLYFLLNTVSLFAGEADVIKVDVKSQKKNTYAFSVTVFHKDSGWSHYADKWDIIGDNGVNYGTRVLLHPHVGEQPFTRSLSGVVIPDGVNKVTIRAHDSVHKYGGRQIAIELP
jgi:hypothetical protein